MTTQRIEIDDLLEYIGEFATKLIGIRSRVLEERKNLTTDQEELAYFMHKVKERGEFPIYKNVLDLPEQNVTEQGLFSGNSVSETAESVAEKVDGTEIDIPDAETKTEEEND